jgi:flavin reductase (DIM6/NTAB) family NADH-FMN oxidoreductase RutF
MTKPAFDAVLGRVPSGIFILTLGTGARSTGMLASWVMQAGFEPASVTVAVKKDRYVADRLKNDEPFALNLVGTAHGALLKHFGKGFAPGEAAFEGVPTKLAATGVPLLDDCLGHLECEPTAHVESGDHLIVVARIVRGKLVGEGEPMVHIRKSGSHY